MPSASRAGSTGPSPSSLRTTARLLELVSLDGPSIADAARVLGVKPATARVRLHRSRARVTARLHGTGAPELPDRALPVEVRP